MLSGVLMERDKEGRVVKMWLSGYHGKDSMLERLPEFMHRDEFSLDRAHFTDTGLAKLKKLPNLKVLTLDGCATDGRLENLRELYVGSPKVSKAGVKTLRQALPRREIELPTNN